MDEKEESSVKRKRAQDDPLQESGSSQQQQIGTKPSKYVRVGVWRGYGCIRLVQIGVWARRKT